MKRLFLAVMLVLFCMFCSSCNTRSPIHTIDSSESAATSESVHMETENTADSAKLTVESTTEYKTTNFDEYDDISMLYLYGCPQSSLPWLRPFCNPQFGQVTYDMSLPKEILHFELYEMDIYDELKKDELYFLRQQFSDIDIQDLNISMYNGITSNRKSYYYYEIDNLNSINKEFYCALRVTDYHVFCFKYIGTKESFEQVLNSISIEPLEESIHPETSLAVKVDEPLEMKSFPFQYALKTETEVVPTNLKIQVSLPISWKDFVMTVSSTDKRFYCAEFGYPCIYTYRYYKNCEYQAFKSNGIYRIESDLTELESRYNLQFELEHTESGTTESGNTYFLNYEEVPLYHAVEYRCYIQLTENYVYSFMLCVDLDNADMIDNVVNSVILVQQNDN